MDCLHARSGDRIQRGLPGSGEDQDEVLTAVPCIIRFFLHQNGRTATLSPRLCSKKGGGGSSILTGWKGVSLPERPCFMLSNPHNPVGRVFTRENSRSWQLCVKAMASICADEIHCDLLLDPDKTHIPIATLNPEVAARTITLMSPSKTFNIAGLGISFAIISDPGLRRRFCKAMPRPAGIVPIVSVLAYTAAIAVYRESTCYDWLAALLLYLRKNRDFLANEINRMPGLSMTRMEATFLASIDTRKAGLKDPAKFFEDAGVGLSDGLPFGAEPGFVRLNFGCPRATLERAVNRMAEAMEGYYKR